jgi:DNA helicase-2/ATP-dependent DNA helicase PcrA
VLAGAGSGKTRVIIERIARLIDSGVPAKRILGVTFTNKAAVQMRDRLRALVGRLATQVTLSTFHALALQLIREETLAAGLRPGFTIYDGSDQRSLVRELTRRVKVADRRLDTGRLLELILQTKRQRREEVELRWGDDYEMAAFDLYPQYIAQMNAYNAIDFDDLILRADRALQDPAVRQRWQARFDALLVDEYQDTSPEQLALLQALCSKERNICAVGDDDQAIYGWRGAAADNIAAFGRHFGGAKQIILNQNYRSTGNILAAANAVIAKNTNRQAKVLFTADAAGEPVRVIECIDADDEAQFICESVRRLHFEGQAYKDMAVLYRSNVQARAFEAALSADRLLYRVVGGQSFFDKKEVRDALAFLGVVHNSQDEVALRRIVNVPSRGIGPQSLERLADFAQKRGCSLWEALEQASEVEGLPKAACAGAHSLVQRLVGARRDLCQAPPGQLAPRVDALLRELGLHDAVMQADDPPKICAQRLENLAAVPDAVQRFEQRAEPGSTDSPLGQFLRTSALVRDKTQDDLADCITLMTLHSAKGLEFPYVFFVGLEEGLLPHKRSLEAVESFDEDLGPQDLSEERRLCYVGMTRARRQLYLTHAHGRSLRGKTQPRTPSRFLQDLPESPGIVRSSRQADGVAGDPAHSEHLAQEFFAKMKAQLGIA